MPENDSDNDKTLATLEDLALTNMYEIKALLAVLVQKGILTREEIASEIEGIKHRK